MKNTSVQDNPKLFGVPIKTLTDRINERSIKIPSGLSRDERRQYALKQQQQ